MKTLPCFHGRKGCAFPGAVFSAFYHDLRKHRDFFVILKEGLHALDKKCSVRSK